MSESRGSVSVPLAVALATLVALALASCAGSTPEPAPRSDEPTERPTVLDEPAGPTVPLYTQTDERWDGLPYAGGTIGTHGCGLVSAAMAWEALSGETCTPVRMLDAVGESCLQGGQNYLPGFCEWMRGQDPEIDRSTQYEDRGRALSDLGEGRLVFGSMHGRLYGDGREYGGHIVLIVGHEDGVVTIHDPCTAYAVRLTERAFDAVGWDYFVSVWREDK